MKKSDFNFFINITRDELGWDFSDQHYDAIDKKLSKFIREKNHNNIEEVIKKIKKGDRLLIEQLHEALAHTDTSFFRDYEVFKQFQDLILPNIKSSLDKSKKLNIWSCGCSSGQEVYSILIALKNNDMLEKWQTSVAGTDFCSKSLAQASKGFYNNFDIQTGINIKEIINNFENKRGGWQINPEFIQYTEFRKYNLLSTPLFKNKFDIIFCRNTIKYFTNEHQRNIIKRIHSTHRSGGLLYIGLKESISGIEDFYDKISGFECLYQAKKL